MGVGPCQSAFCNSLAYVETNTSSLLMKCHNMLTILKPNVCYQGIFLNARQDIGQLRPYTTFCTCVVE